MKLERRGKRIREKGGKGKITKVIKEHKKRVTGKDTNKNYFPSVG